MKMADNENLVEVAEEAAVAREKTSESFGAKVKEWFRKLIVKLKRQTQLIPLVVILITSLVYLVSLGTYSQVVEKNTGIANAGISIFVNTLLSILVLAMFLNAFPKRKKPNLVFIGVVFLMLAIMIGMDILYYVNLNKLLNETGGGNQQVIDIILATYPEIGKSRTLVWTHVAFVAVSIVVFALLPVYKKGINKINTKKDLDENELSEEIDTSAEV